MKIKNHIIIFIQSFLENHPFRSFISHVYRNRTDFELFLQLSNSSNIQFYSLSNPTVFPDPNFLNSPSQSRGKYFSRKNRIGWPVSNSIIETRGSWIAKQSWYKKDSKEVHSRSVFFSFLSSSFFIFTKSSYRR